MKKSLSSLSFQSMDRSALRALKGGGMSVGAVFCENKRCVPFQPNQCDVSTQFMCYCGSTTSPGVYACTKG